ncbi:MAG: hypothetical protein V7L00_17825 [Nostoc sp.]|uniref:hypothetical protein n=1 Tax=Nostoc sp. TaxID=1180 RepID=UPI002FF76620
MMTVQQLIEKLRRYDGYSYVRVNLVTDDLEREIDIESVYEEPFGHVLIKVRPPVETAEESTVIFDPIAC